MSRHLRKLLRQIEAVEVIQLQPGDRLVLRVPETTTTTEAERLREVLTPRLPGEFVILPRSIGLEVLRPIGDPKP
jgi:hypothetical protein